MEILANTDAITGAILKIIDGVAEDGEVYLVSAFIQIQKQTEKWQNLTNRIDFKREDKNVKFIFIVNDEKNNEGEIREILKNYSDQIWLVPNLHAKFYYNGEHLLISSMNLYFHSAKNNQEIGVELKKPKSPTNEETEIYENSKRQIEDYISILKRGGRNILSVKNEEKQIELKLIRWGKGYSLRANNNQKLGYCIVCGEATPKADYREGRIVRCDTHWKQNKYPKQPIKGSACHICGQKADVNTEKAFCSSCDTQISVLKEMNPPIKQNKKPTRF